MREEIELIQILKAFRGHAKALLTIMALTITAFFGYVHLGTEKKFKSSAVITIPSRYFQQPSVEDILPAVQEPSEMRTLREGLITSVLRREFLEEMRLKYNLFPAQEIIGEYKYEVEMDKLYKRFEMISLGATSFQLGFVGTNPEISYAITTDFLEAVKQRLLSDRMQKLVSIRDDMLARVDSLGFSVKQAGDPLSSARPEILRGELTQIDGILKTLKGKYTDQHPVVEQYLVRKSLIVKWLTDNNIPIKGPTEARNDIKGISSGGFADMDRYLDLLKRIDRVNVSIDFERKNPSNLVEVSIFPDKPLFAVWPNNRLVGLWSILVGLLFCALYLAIRSINNIQVSPSVMIANKLEIPNLGSIPKLNMATIESSEIKSAEKQGSVLS